MRKVFYIDQQSYSNLAIYDHSLLSNIVEENTEVRIDYWGNSKYAYKAMPQAINTHHIFRYSSYNNSVCRLLSYLWSVLRLCVALLVRRPDVVHLQWIKAFQLDYLCLWIAKHICKSKIVFTAHNLLPHNSDGKEKKSYGKVYRIADSVIVHTETSKEDFKTLFPDYAHKASVVAHGVLPNNFEEEEIDRKAAEIREELNISKDTVVFSMLGYQSYYKGTDIVCNAWNSSEVLSKGDYVLLVAGKCAPDAVPTNLAANVLVSNRFLSDLDFLGYLKLTDVLLLPYRIIDQSGLLLTAFNSCIPVCVSDVGELAKPLAVAKVGWKFDSLEIEDVQKMIEQIVENPGEIAQIKADESAWAKILKMYGWAESARLTSIIYMS